MPLHLNLIYLIKNLFPRSLQDGLLSAQGTDSWRCTHANNIMKYLKNISGMLFWGLFVFQSSSVALLVNVMWP